MEEFQWQNTTPLAGTSGTGDIGTHSIVSDNVCEVDQLRTHKTNTTNKWLATILAAVPGATIDWKDSIKAPPAVRQLEQAIPRPRHKRRSASRSMQSKAVAAGGRAETPESTSYLALPRPPARRAPDHERDARSPLRRGFSGGAPPVAAAVPARGRERPRPAVLPGSGATSPAPVPRGGTPPSTFHRRRRSRPRGRRRRRRSATADLAGFSPPTAHGWSLATVAASS